MKLREIFDRVLVLSGQFMMAEDIELDQDKFAMIVQAALGTYNNYSPYFTNFNLNMNEAANGGLVYTFTSTSEPCGIPDWVSDVVPVRLAGVHPWYIRERDEMRNSNIQIKRTFPWEYRKPNLYLPMEGLMDITAVYNHKLQVVTYRDIQTGAIRKDTVCNTISEQDDEFFNYLQGLFLKSLGRNRRAFTLNELPITTDAGELVSEGDQMMKDAEAQMEQKDHKWWLAYR